VTAWRLRRAGGAEAQPAGGMPIVTLDGVRAVALLGAFLAASWPLVFFTLWIGPRL
jgi:hypothetical protein